MDSGGHTDDFLETVDSGGHTDDFLETVDSGGHTDDFLEPMDSTVEYLHSKFGEFLFLLLFNYV